MYAFLLEELLKSCQVIFHCPEFKIKDDHS